MKDIKEIYEIVRLVNDNHYYKTTLTRYVSETYYRRIMNLVTPGSLAEKIMTSNFFKINSGNLTDKQLWVIAYDLQKSGAVDDEIEDKEVKVDKTKENKIATQGVLDYVKSNGKLLTQYYTWLKSSKFKKEFFSKRYTMESANAFIAAE